MTRGRFIVLEGTDGSGTTSQTSRLVAALVARGIPCIATREPSQGPVGQLLRAALEQRLVRVSVPAKLDWATLALLFAADRRDHVANEIEPQLQSGTWVISDRYTLSSRIYQSLTAPDRESAAGWVEELNRMALPADLVMVLDVPPEVAHARRMLRGGPEEIFDSASLQVQLAKAYIDARAVGEEALEHLDGACPLDEVSYQIWEVMKKHFPVLGGTPSRGGT